MARSFFSLKFIGVLGVVLCLPAWAAGAHDHGVGRLDVVVDKAGFTIALELPMDVLVGFERAPRTDKERQALAAAGEKLKDGASLFVPAGAAACRVGQVEVALPQATGEHADAEARYEFQCAQAKDLASIETTLFRQFPRLYRLEVQRVGPRGQGGGRLTPKAPVLRW